MVGSQCAELVGLEQAGKQLANVGDRRWQSNGDQVGHLGGVECRQLGGAPGLEKPSVHCGALANGVVGNGSRFPSRGSCSPVSAANFALAIQAV